MQDDDALIQRVSASMESLNTRIARLACALHVPLNESSALSALMAKQPVQTIALDRRTVSIDVAQVDLNSDRRQANQHEELRGLLLLRYHMETISLNDNGWLVTSEAMARAEAHLLRQGFKPGADGLSLDSIFNVA